MPANLHVGELTIYILVNGIEEGHQFLVSRDTQDFLDFFVLDENSVDRSGVPDLHHLEGPKCCCR